MIPGKIRGAPPQDMVERAEQQRKANEDWNLRNAKKFRLGFRKGGVISRSKFTPATSQDAETLAIQEYLKRAR